VTNIQPRKQRPAFEAALKSAMNTPHKPLKEKPKVKKAAKNKKIVKTSVQTA